MDHDELQRELVAARTILAWYADTANYEPPARITNGQPRQAAVMRDRGSLARKILATLPKGRHDDPRDQSS